MTTPADRVSAATETELSRLGSEKLLLAVTGADIRDATVAGALEATLAVAADRCETWAAKTADSDAAEALRSAAERYTELREETLKAWPDAEDVSDAMVDPDDPGDAAGRIGAGLVGLPLVLDRLLLQAVSYHVNEANTAVADQLRGIRESVSAILDTATAVSDDESETAAITVVEGAYERYANRLDRMGLDPKPLC